MISHPAHPALERMDRAQIEASSWSVCNGS